MKAKDWVCLVDEANSRLTLANKQRPRFILGSRGELAQSTDYGHCIFAAKNLEGHSLTPEQAVELGRWLVETFDMQEVPG